MKKNILSLLLCVFVFFLVNTQFASSHCGRHLSLSTEKGTEEVAPAKSAINPILANDVVWFYPKDTVVMAYLDLTKKNISEVQAIIKSQMDSENPDEDLTKILEGLAIIENFTLSFGPDLTFGMLKQSEEGKKPSVFTAIKLKVKDFSLGSIITLFGKSQEIENQTIDGIEVQCLKGKSNDLFFTTYNGYLLISDSIDVIKIALNNYKTRPDNFLTPDKAQKAAKYLSNDSVLIALTNNFELSKAIKAQNDAKKASKKEESKVETTEDNTEENIEEETNTDTDVKEEKADQNDENSDSKTEEPQKEPDKFMVYFNELQQSANYTATAIYLKNNSIGIKSYTPYDLTFLDKLNPELKQSIVNMLNSAKYYNVSESLPLETSAYLLISNLAGISDIVKNIDDEKFQTGFASLKVMFAAMTGLDFDSEFTPVFSGQTTVAILPGNETPEPALIISDKENTTTVLDKLTETIQKLEPTSTVKTKKINKSNFTVLSMEKFPAGLTFGTINNIIAFANFDIIKNLAKASNKTSNLLVSSESYKDFDNLTKEPCNAALYMEFDNLKKFFGGVSKELPPEIEKIVKSLYVSIANKKDNVFQITILLQLKNKK